MRRHELSERQWQRLAPLLPPQKPTVGRPNLDHRTILNGLRWRLRTGCPWRDIPERYGKWETIYSRFRRWQQAGIWDRILAVIQAEDDAKGQLDWSLHMVDATVVRAHQHAAGAGKKGGTRPLAGAGAASVPRATSGPSAPASP